MNINKYIRSSIRKQQFYIEIKKDIDGMPASNMVSLNKFLNRIDYNKKYITHLIFKNNIKYIEYFSKSGIYININTNELKEKISSKLKIIKHLSKIYTNIFANIKNLVKLTCFNGSLQIVKYIISLDMNIHPEWIIEYSVTARKINILKYFLKQNNNICINGEMLLYAAIQSGYFDITKYLIKNGAYIYLNKETALLYALENKHLSLAKYLYKFYTKLHLKNVLYQIVQTGDVNTVKFLISLGANIKENKNELIQICRDNSNARVYEFLKKYR